MVIDPERVTEYADELGVSILPVADLHYSAIADDDPLSTTSAGHG